MFIGTKAIKIKDPIEWWGPLNEPLEWADIDFSDILVQQRDHRWYQHQGQLRQQHWWEQQRRQRRQQQQRQQRRRQHLFIWLLETRHTIFIRRSIAAVPRHPAVTDLADLAWASFEAQKNSEFSRTGHNLRLWSLYNKRSLFQKSILIQLCKGLSPRHDQQSEWQGPLVNSCCDEA